MRRTVKAVDGVRSLQRRRETGEVVRLKLGREAEVTPRPELLTFTSFDCEATTFCLDHGCFSATTALLFAPC